MKNVKIKKINQHKSAMSQMYSLKRFLTLAPFSFYYICTLVMKC